MRQRWGKRLGLMAKVAEAFVLGVAILTIGACIAILWTLISDPRKGEEWTSGLHPAQFYRELDADLIETYVGVFVVGHNSGDSVGSTLEALGYGADVIEIDVVSLDGQLYAAHDTPSAWIGNRLFRGPPLERVWIAAGGAHAVKLDLKESGPAFTELVLRFLEERRGQRRVIVVSSDPAVLRRIAEQEPVVLRFLGIGTADRYDKLTDDPSLVELIDGVSMNQALINDERAGWLEEREIITLAWTVNQLKRVNELVLLGVDAITTDNLAIMKLLGGKLGLEPVLERPAASPEAGDSNPAKSARAATTLAGRFELRKAPPRTQNLLLPERPRTTEHLRSSPQVVYLPEQSWQQQHR